jgi:hypothetical protein
VKEMTDEDVLQLIVNEYYEKKLAGKPATG